MGGGGKLTTSSRALDTAKLIELNGCIIDLRIAATAAPNADLSLTDGDLLVGSTPNEELSDILGPATPNLAGAYSIGAIETLQGALGVQQDEFARRKTDFFRGLIDDPSVDRYKVLENLYKLGDTSIVDIVIKDLENEDPSVRREALIFIASFQIDLALPDVVVLISDPDTSVAVEAVKSLGKLGKIAKDTAPRLAQIIFEGTAPREVIIRAIESLGKIGEPTDKNLSILRKITERSWNDETFRAAALTARFAIGDPQIIDDLKYFIEADPKVVTVCAELLEASGDKTAIPILLKVYEPLKHDMFKRDLAVLRALMQLEEPSISLNVIEGESTENIKEYFRRLGHAEALPRLIEAFCKGYEADVQVVIIEILTEIGQSAIPELVTILQNSSAPIATRAWAMMALERIGLTELSWFAIMEVWKSGDEFLAEDAGKIIFSPPQ